VIIQLYEQKSKQSDYIMLVLGIETSCDETGLALYDSEKGLLADELFSQIDIHQEYGGVVPELASRDHADRILPLLKNLFKSVNKSLDDIDLIAYTAGPGLKGCLLVGSTFARSLAYITDKPIISINHVEAHLLAPFMEYSELSFPFFGLLISGGHTMIVDAKSIGEYEIMGETLDDAVGEAFDKSAKLMGLDYPGGPLIEMLAKDGVEGSYKFPRPILNKPNCNFSFSGLKTHIMLTWKASKKTKQDQKNISLELQNAVADCLVGKLKRAHSEKGYSSIVISGGVSANQFIRQKITNFSESINSKAYYPTKKFCTDNGAMIAYAGYKKYEAGQIYDLQGEVKPRWPLDKLNEYL
jgi:N6-L-threonylcarbamoyladenine synthase